MTKTELSATASAPSSVESEKKERPHRDLLRWALEQARRDLVDLSRRNRLLHAPLTGKRPWCMAIIGVSADEVHEKLYRQENFRGYSFAAQESQEKETTRNVAAFPSKAKQGASRNRWPPLQTLLPPDKLERRLTKIFREERTLEEEQGLSTLYLAIGFLKWFEADQSDESFAPLILLPVTLLRVPGGHGYLLCGRDDEIVANISLREKLKSNFSIQLPEFPENEDWKPSDYFESVAREITRQPRWEVDRNAVGLGFFSFSKFLMWHDLDPAAWPDGALLHHTLIDVLLGDNSEFEAYPPLVADDEPIDKRIDLSKCIHVVDADSSQTVVIEESRNNRNLVVQGPPGTGKSQTITNIIASAVHSDKTVLFVAEKTAALEVVHDRLKKAGLSALCLAMHSRKANKREVFKSLEQALRLSDTPRLDNTLSAKLASCRDKLNQWSTLIHKPIARSGRSAFDVIGAQMKLRADGIRLLDSQFVEAAEWSAEKLSSGEVAVDRVAKAIARLGIIPKTHPWFGTNIGSQSPFDLDRLIPKLRTTKANLDALAARLTKVTGPLIDHREPCFADAFGTIDALRHVAVAPEASRSVLGAPAWNNNLALLERAIDEGERLTAIITNIEAKFRPEAWSFDPAASLFILRADGPSFLRRFSSRFRQSLADLRAICSTKPPKALKDRIAHLEELQRAQESRREFSKNITVLSASLGPLWAEFKTPWQDGRTLLAWARVAQSKLGGSRLLTLAAHTKDVRIFSDLARDLEMIANGARSTFDDICVKVRADLEALFGKSDYDGVPITHLAARLSIWLKNVTAINDWVEARDALSNLRNEGLGTIADGLADGTIDPKEARPITDLLISESLWHQATIETPEIDRIQGAVRNQCVSEFRELDQERKVAARQEVLASYLSQRPSGYAGQMGIVRAEIDKKRRHRSIRKLMADAGPAVQRLKPIFLMSPLSAAQFLPPGQISFDVLVIDEASQVAPEDALGVVARAKQMIVVGDHKQLPPTNFFKMVNAGADDAEEDSSDAVTVDRPSDFESILTLSRTRGMSERMLKWHYRSKHPSLIALSNEECYAGRLLLPPSPFVQTSEFGLSLVQTPRGHYDRGGTSRDLVQAEQVAKAIAQHIREHPNKSLGIACLSAQQRDAVDDMIDKLGIRSEAEVFTPKDERLFVKNLEAVQGDERDVIFISVGYGVAPNQSRPFLNFGPVSREGGDRRLNVLASRAREKCVVFSSITAADIPADSELRGTRMLRALLSFAETGKLGAGTLHGGGFDSPFEEAVARVVREAGYHAHSQVGVSGFRIDLGIIDPAKPGEYILGVECDGAAYHSARSARDRDRLRQQVLEEKGWRLYRIWSTEWFRNPQRETEKLLAAIRAAKEKAGTRVEPLVEDELVEPEIAESAGDPETLTDGIEQLGLSSEIDYKECALTVPYRRELLEFAVPEIARIALTVVEAEGPIHTEEVARRIREAFGLQKTGRRILAHVRRGLLHQSRKGMISRDGEFWSVSGRDLEAVRSRRNAALPLRKAGMIAPAEYQMAIMNIVSEVVAISRDDLLVETARSFGFERTGADLKEAIDQQTEALLKAARLRTDGELLRAARYTPQ